MQPYKGGCDFRGRHSVDDAALLIPPPAATILQHVFPSGQTSTLPYAVCFLGHVSHAVTNKKPLPPLYSPASSTLELSNPGKGEKQNKTRGRTFFKRKKRVIDERQKRGFRGDFASFTLPQ